MKFIISEIQQEKLISKWMSNYSPEILDIIEHPKYPNSIFFKKNGKVIMEKDKSNKIFYFDYDTIWSPLMDKFQMDRKEIKEYLKYWLNDIFNIDDYECAIMPPFFKSSSWKTLSKH